MGGRIKSGVPQLDELLNGGIPERSLIVVEGGPGTGKTIFGLQFLWEGIRNGEHGVLVTTDEYPSKITAMLQDFGWKPKREDEFVIVDSFSSNFGRASGRYAVQDLGDLNELIEVIVSAVKTVSARRLVIDNFTSLCLSKPVSPRSILMNIKRISSVFGCTSLVLLNQEDRMLEHMADGLIKLHIDDGKGELRRIMSVLKMRGTPLRPRKLYFEIGEEGLSLLTGV